MDVLRHLVSGDKYRFKDPTTGTDLDLTYITERIIAMVRYLGSVDVFACCARAYLMCGLF